jgi:ribonuclease HI
MSGSDPDTTNNRMELQAALNALQSLDDPHRVDLYTDSQYLRRGITEWLPRWQANDWQTTAKNGVKNQDLWRPLAIEMGRHEITWHWTRGHAGDRWNERADQLASEAIPTPPLPLDDDQAVHLFTAASYKGKTKTGGWAVVLRFRDQTKSLSGTEKNTTSNRMHIRSAIEGLKALKRPLPVHLYTASDYLKNGATLWYKGWVAHNWQTKGGKPVSHRDAWEALLRLDAHYPVTWHVVNRSEMPAEMEQAKTLASEAAANG